MALLCVLIGGTAPERDDLSGEVTAAGHRVVGEPAEGLSGIDVALLLDETRAIPLPNPDPDGCLLVGLSRSGAPEELARLFQSGVDDYLIWPADRSELPALLTVLQRRRANRIRWLEQRARDEIERRRLAEARLSATESLARAFLDGAPQRMGVVELVGDDDYRLVLVNEATAQAHGLSPHELMGKLASDTDFDRHGLQTFLEHARGATAPVHFETEVGEPGQRRSFAVTVVPLGAGLEGPRLGYVSEEITARRLAVALLRESEERHRSESHMATVGTLAAGVAHEINNPLAYVLTNIAYVEEDLRQRPTNGGADFTELREALAEARGGGERVRDIVRDLKIFSRAEGGMRGPVDVRHVLEVSLRMAGNELRHRARVQTELAQVPLVLADESQLAQVFVNLLTNAAQALPERPGDDNLVCVRLSSAPDGRVSIEVQDNGRGMTADEARRVFEPFFTTRPVGTGRGLGLSVCHGIITALGGAIEVSSTPEQGSIFRVLLPALGARAEPEPPPPPPAATAGKPRVLVIDDEPFLLRSCARILAGDAEVETEPDPRAALERLRDPAQHFDAVLCDLMMPGLSGMALFEALSPARPELLGHVGFLTGGAFTPAARAFLARPGVRHLEKPFTAAALKELVRLLLATTPR